MPRFDVAVVGAGVHGASAAMHLAERGLRPLVLERGEPASGPTGRSSAVLRGYYVNEFLAKATRESIDLLHDFKEWTQGGEAGLVTCGALFLHGAEDGPRLRESAQRLNGLGTTTDVLDRTRLAAEFPEFKLDGIAWGVWEEGAGHADPSGVTFGMLNRAVALGAEVRRHTRVTGLERSGADWVVSTSGGDAETVSKVLLAVGPWSSQLLGMLDVRLPLWAERHIIATFGWGAASRLSFVWASVPDGLYFKPEVHAQYLVGTLLPEAQVDPDWYDEELSASEQTRIASGTVERIPGLLESELKSGYTALYDVAPDWQPVIGEVEDGVFIVAGTAGHGFKWAPALGAHMADLVSGAEPDPGLAQFSPRRFAAGALVDAGYGAARILG